MKTFILIVMTICLSYPNHVMAREPRLIKSDSFSYFFIKSENERKGTVIFLHGSVKFFITKSTDDITLNDLIESNKYILPVLKDYDLILPVANQHFNWLNKEQSEKINQSLRTICGSESNVCIAGFSDGGSGAFKLIHSSGNFYQKAVLFNAYPQHGWFTRNLQFNSNTSITFVAGKQDKTVPYEFPLIEYLKLKCINPSTRFIMTDNAHSFETYDSAFLNSVFCASTPDLDQSKAPFPGLIINENLIELYPFRASVIRKYGLKKDFLNLPVSHIKQKKILKKLKKAPLQIKVSHNCDDQGVLTIETEIKDKEKIICRETGKFELKKLL